jgi:capsule polysaccharide export protein KpsE/RkpR
MTQAVTKPEPQIPGHILPEASEEVPLESVFPRFFSFWKQKRFLGKAAMAGLLAGSILAFALPRRYESTTRLMPPDAQSTSGSGMLTALMAMNSSSQSAPTARTNPDLSLLAGDLLGAKSTGALFVGILRSQTVEDRLVDRFDLRKVYSARYQQDARKKLEQRTTISEDRKSGIISIAVQDSDPKRATALAQANVDELNVLVAQLSTSAAHRERLFLEGRLATVKDDLEQASQRFSQFSSKNETIDLKDEARAILQNSATIEGQLIAAQSELQGLKAIYSDENVRVRATQARITELRRQLAKLGGRKDVDQEQVATDPNDSSLPTIRNLPLLGASYTDLYRRMQLEEVVFQALTEQYELVKVQEAKETPSVKVLDAPNIPERRSFPPRLLIILVFGLMGLIGGAFYLHAEERWGKLEANDPGKVFVGEVVQAVNARMPWTTPNGSRFHQAAHRIWVKVVLHEREKREDEEQ